MWLRAFLSFTGFEAETTMMRSMFIGGIAVAGLLTMAAPAPAFAGAVQVVPWEDSGSVVNEVGAEGCCGHGVVVPHLVVGTTHGRDRRVDPRSLSDLLN